MQAKADLDFSGNLWLYSQRFRESQPCAPRHQTNFLLTGKVKMSTDRDAFLNGVEGALESAISKLCGIYETCLIDAGGDTAKEAECKQIRDRSLQFAKRAYTDMLEAVNQQWPHGS